MVERRGWFDVLAYVVLLAGVAVVFLPVWVTLVASTRSADEVLAVPMSLWPGAHAIENYTAALGAGAGNAGLPGARMMGVSLICALALAIGKIAISLLSAFAIVYWRFRFRRLCFWLIFVTLMLPVEVRILPTFKVVADFGMLNSWAGLTLPLIASATATFLFRQFFMTLPDELVEAARIDGAGPLRFFRDMLLPLSRTNIAALSVSLFIYGWVQYLWPTLVTTDPKYYTIVMGIRRLVAVAEADPQWNFVMAAVILAMLPPVLVVVFMQRLFVKGLIETEK